ncbi:hypothetical protein AURDEDRAFT_166454 [Auricularia subglabra TFB-10046 SS5]|nr:hypothetical protein AURDEDRAFT_166454 [Auricularia subglabra TFB-10046 SS5]
MSSLQESIAIHTTSSVIVAGRRGPGCEIAKNLVLAGVKSIALYEPHPVTLRDLGSQSAAELTSLAPCPIAELAAQTSDELVPMAEVVGALVAEEALKTLCPITQQLYFDTLEALPSVRPSNHLSAAFFAQLASLQIQTSL